MSIGRIGLWIFLVPTAAILWKIPSAQFASSIGWPAVVLDVTGLLIFSAYNFGKKPECQEILKILAGRIGFGTDAPAIPNVPGIQGVVDHAEATIGGSSPTAAHGSDALDAQPLAEEGQGLDESITNN
jgi:hypothetical protein